MRGDAYQICLEVGGGSHLEPFKIRAWQSGHRVLAASLTQGRSSSNRSYYPSIPSSSVRRHVLEPACQQSTEASDEPSAPDNGERRMHDGWGLLRQIFLFIGASTVIVYGHISK